MRIAILLLLLCFTAVLSLGQSIPAIKARALDGTEIILPSPGSQKILVFIVGFTRKSGEVCKVWGKKIASDYHDDGRLAYFSLPVLESAPSLLRPMIVHGIRKGLPAEEWHHFVPIFSNEAEWKRLVGFSGPDDAYIVVTAQDGQIYWQAHSPYSENAYADLKKSVTTLKSRSPGTQPSN
jgi:hypothetical protein